MVADREAAARAIAEAAKRTRTPLPRAVWAAGLVAGVICLGALALSWWLADPIPQSAVRYPQSIPSTSSSNGFTIGIVIGLVCGIAIGSLMALRRRKH
jgi:LPXTG-motif cell wall-anchored protein